MEFFSSGLCKFYWGNLKEVGSGFNVKVLDLKRWLQEDEGGPHHHGQAPHGAHRALLRHQLLLHHQVRNYQDLLFSLILISTESGNRIRTCSLNPDLVPDFLAESGSGLNLSLNSDPIRIRIQTKIYYYKICKKNLIWKFIGNGSKTVICLLKPMQRTFWLFKQEISSSFPFWVPILACLYFDPAPDWESGAGSSDPIESGSETLFINPSHCLFLFDIESPILTVNLIGKCSTVPYRSVSVPNY